jgi:hypothetical protein
MTGSSLRLPVEDLVERVRRGLVRIPPFQRSLRWKNADVVDFLDSLYRGYPVGSLLFYQHPAQADRHPVGPLVVEAPETSKAWWVIDGQQRVTAVAASLGRPVPLPVRPRKNDPYVVFFNAGRQAFEGPPATGRFPSDWVPLPELLDAARLSEWVGGWQHRGDEALRRAVFEAGARLRESEIPVYLVETEESARQIYERVHKTGKSLGWAAVHTALLTSGGSSPSTLEELSAELAGIGMGSLDREQLLSCLFAWRGSEPPRTFAETDPRVLSEEAQELFPVLRRVLSFLRRDAAIPHLGLLPQPILLGVLTLFFRRFAEPRPRTRTLLARWFWRTALGGRRLDGQTLRRNGIAAIRHDEEESMQALLRSAPKDRPPLLTIPEAFDAQAAESRIALLALAHLGPRLLTTGEPIDIASLLERQGKNAAVKIVADSGLAGAQSAANRVLHPKSAPIHRLVRERMSADGMDDPVLKSHAIGRRAAELLAAGDLPGFLAQRSTALSGEVRRFGERMAAWDHNDRPSLDHLLAEAGVEA